ncbi:MAG TPA: class I SAM-dependent methyltransferase [Rhodanobacteraceae bacterium]|jgi:2-polyprenyl-3-methyl-5-hydroxy-6-metoxy-1,4-benzoquinol methylase|nr:class I SAM-dependent methyltransferase [Rhodanobacteraceae bacterium]
MLRSWEKNATAWTEAVRERRIASRRAGTDDAIIAAVLRAAPSRVLDVGCGEGWLARALSTRGCRVVGIDASEALIASARMLGGARFELMTYADLSSRAAELGLRFDAVVCNFSLLEAEITPVLEALREILNPRGRLFIQTVHPWVANGSEPYVDGWRIEEFADFASGFTEPMPWYFRTLGAWIGAVSAGGFRVASVDEPIDAASGHPLSLLIEAEPVLAKAPR